MEPSVDLYLISTTPACIARTFTGQKVIIASRIFRKCTKQRSASADDPGLAILKLDEDHILLVEQSAKRQRRASSVGATLPDVELIPTTGRKSKSNHRNRFVDPPSIETGLFNGTQRDSMHGRYTLEDHFEEGFLMDWFHNAKRPTEISVSCVTSKHLFVSAILLAAMTPVRRHAYVILLMDDVEILSRTGCYLEKALARSSLA